ncbi:hypothetical protein Pla175_45720 [Pirellulimonas nuda]|uniref:Tetratricopeptide repeat-like domain-containing protein n=1 Tax=Pirellulimonas nuda TaxID=2528009 RepID=A0A518DID5_9BACT|nr:hypothetical protein [Pirellulimonas nuda]QDU91152.1 hypothetical protein Pla175_45720 [Pirellulimonas nuda]
MDAKHRHELQENALADWLGNFIDQVRPYVPVLIAAVVALVVGVVGWGAYRGSRAEAKADAWRLYSDAMVGGMPTPALLEQAADEASGTAVADWAALTLADSELWQASEAFFADRTRAQQSLERAEPLYKSLVGASDPWISGRARYGLARSAEVAGNTEEAVKLYGLVTGALAPLAKQRVEELKSPAAVETVAWLAESQASLPGTGAGDGPAAEGGQLTPDDVLMPAPEGGLPSIDDMLKKYDTPEESADEEASEGADADSTPASEDVDAEADKPEADTDAKPSDE